MPCHAHSWRLESNVTPGGAIFRHFTRDTRSTPLALLSIRDETSAQFILEDTVTIKKKGNPARLFSRAPPEKLNFTNPGNELGGEKISKKTKMDEKTATTGEWRSFFFFLSSSIISSAYLSRICSCMKIYFVRCKVFTSGFYSNGCW